MAHHTDAEAEPDKGWEITEMYLLEAEEAVTEAEEAGDTTRAADAREGFSYLAQEIFERGIMYQVNNSVLHQYGYALAVTLDESDNVIGLALHKTTDPLGIWFDEATSEIGRGKLRAAGFLGRESEKEGSDAGSSDHG